MTEKDLTGIARIAAELLVMLAAIIEMSDDVTKGKSPLDTQGRLLRLQGSIQKNKGRVRTYIRAVREQLDAEAEK